MYDLEVRRDDLAVIRVLESRPPDPESGPVLAVVERFGLSANNITYRRLGDRLRY